MLVVEVVLATSAEVALYRLELDDYDSKTVHALMDNRQALEAARDHVASIREEAFVLPDGRKVFKTKDGKHVVDETGAELSKSVIDPEMIENTRPFWETYEAAVKTELRLKEQQDELLSYQTKLDKARQRLDEGDITKGELEDLKSDLAANMPNAVREKLGIEQLSADGTQPIKTRGFTVPMIRRTICVDTERRILHGRGNARAASYSLERLTKPWFVRWRGMSKPLVSDELWAAIEPLIPPSPAKPKGGRPPCDNRTALTGIVFVLRSGIPWEMLPGELGCSGMTCWRRLRDWQAAGVWDKLHRVLLERLADADRLDWSRASLDSASVAAKKGGLRPARTRRIAANRARSATLWSTGTARRSA